MFRLFGKFWLIMNIIRFDWGVMSNVEVRYVNVIINIKCCCWKCFIKNKIIVKNKNND